MKVRMLRIFTALLLCATVLPLFALTPCAQASENGIILSESVGKDSFYYSCRDVLIDPESSNTSLQSVSGGAVYLSAGLFDSTGVEADSLNGVADVRISLTKKTKIKAVGCIAFMIKTVSEAKELVLGVKVITDRETEYSATLLSGSTYAVFLPINGSGTVAFSGIEVSLQSEGEECSFKVSDIILTDAHGIADSTPFLTGKYSASNGSFQITDESAVFTLNGTNGSISSAELDYALKHQQNGVKIIFANGASAKSLVFSYTLNGKAYSQSTELSEGWGTYRFSFSNASASDVLSEVEFEFKDSQGGEIEISEISLIYVPDVSPKVCTAVYENGILRVSGSCSVPTGAEYIALYRTDRGEIENSTVCERILAAESFSFSLLGEEALLYGYIPVFEGEGVFQPICEAIYPTGAEKLGVDAAEAETVGKKGLICTSGEVIKDLGVKQAYVTVDPELFISENESKYFFAFSGSVYYINTVALNRLDHTVKTAYASECRVMLRVDVGDLSFGAYASLLSFLSHRYSDEKNGIVCNYIVGDGLNLKYDLQEAKALLNVAHNAIVSGNRNAYAVVPVSDAEGIYAPDDFVYCMKKMCDFGFGAILTVDGTDGIKFVSGISELTEVGDVSVVCEKNALEAETVRNFIENFYVYSALENVSAVFAARQTDGDGILGIYELTVDGDSVQTACREDFYGVYKYADTSRAEQTVGKYVSLEPYQTEIFKYLNANRIDGIVSLENDLILQNTVCEPSDTELWKQGGGATSVSQTTVAGRKALCLTFDLDGNTAGYVSFKPKETLSSEEGFCMLLYADYLPEGTDKLKLKMYSKNGLNVYSGECEIGAEKLVEVYVDVNTLDTLELAVEGEKMSPRISVYGIYTCQKRPDETVSSETDVQTDGSQNIGDENAVSIQTVVTVFAVLTFIVGALISAYFMYFKKLKHKQ